MLPTFPIPYKRLNDFEIDWKSDDIIRQGQHSKVYKAYPKWIDEEMTKYMYESYAVKIIPLTPPTTLEKVAQEIAVIERWIGVNELIGLEATEAYVAIITPFANGGTLEDYLPTLLEQKHDIINNNNENELTTDQRHSKYLGHMYPILRGLFDRLIHHSDDSVLHRDLRLSNIVFNSNSEIDEYVQIIDNGHATRTDSSRLNEDKQRNEDSYFYCVNAPEVNDGKPYTFASEMWSFGMILLSLWTCEKPFNNELTNASVSNITLISVFNLFKRSFVSCDLNRSLRRFDHQH
jgi:serine/threonine protein kinase